MAAPRAKKKTGKPERDHADDGEVGEVDVFDHAVAEDVDLGADGGGEIIAAGEVAVEGVERDGGDGERDGAEVGPGVAAEEADGSEADGDAEESYFVGCPSHERPVRLERRAAGATVTVGEECTGAASWWSA